MMKEMKYQEIVKHLNNKGFVENGYWKFNDHSKISHKLDYVICGSNKENGMKLYCWVEKTSNADEVAFIIYIGQTTKTIKNRMSQHRNGFRVKGGSNSGRKKFAFIEHLLKVDESEIIVFVHELPKSSNLLADEGNLINEWKKFRNHWLFLNEIV